MRIEAPFRRTKEPAKALGAAPPAAVVTVLVGVELLILEWQYK